MDTIWSLYADHKPSSLPSVFVNSWIKNYDPGGWMNRAALNTTTLEGARTLSVALIRTRPVQLNWLVVWTPPTCFIRVCSFLKLIERALTLLRSSSSILGSQRWEEGVHVVHTYIGCAVQHYLCGIVCEGRSVSFSSLHVHKMKCLSSL